MKKIAISLHNTFIRKDSEFEVNIEAAIRAPILDLVEQNDQRCFSDAKEHILKLMEPLFAKFKSSFIFEKMKKELGNRPARTSTHHPHTYIYTYTHPLSMLSANQYHVYL